MSAAAEQQGLSAETLQQLGVVDKLERAFNGNNNRSGKAPNVQQYDDLSAAYSKLGDLYLSDGLIDEAIHAKERGLMIIDDSLGALRASKDNGKSADLLRLKEGMLAEHFANLGYLCKEWQMLPQACKYYTASAAKARDAYGEDSVDYVMCLVPYCALLMEIANSETPDADAAAHVLELLGGAGGGGGGGEAIALLERELGEEHDLCSEAHLILNAAYDYQETHNSLLALGIGGFDEEDAAAAAAAAADDMEDIPLPEDNAPSPTHYSSGVYDYRGVASPEASGSLAGDSLTGGGQSISTLGVRSAVSGSVDDGAVTVMSEHYKGGKASSKAALALGAFGGTHNDMLAFIREKADNAGADSGDEAGFGVDDLADSNYKEGVTSLHTVASHNAERVHAVEAQHETGDKLEYSVEFLQLNASQPKLRDYFYRHNEEAYLQKVGEKLIMPIFPAQLKEGGKYSAATVQLHRYTMSVRIQRLMLIDEITDLTKKVDEWEELHALCIRKKDAHRIKMLALEDELVHMAEDRNANGAKTARPMSNFGCFLTTRDGWQVVADLLKREVRRLQNPEFNLAGTEDVEESLTVQDCTELWELLHWWQLFYSTQIRARVGLKHYPVHARTEKVVKKDQYALSDDEASDDGSKVKKKKEKKSKKSQKEKEKEKQKQADADRNSESNTLNASQTVGNGADNGDGDLNAAVQLTTEASAPASEDQGLEAQLTKIKRAAELAEQAHPESVIGSVRPDFDDDSTIKSRSTLGHGEDAKAGVAAASAAEDDDDMSLNSTPSMVEAKGRPTSKTAAAAAAAAASVPAPEQKKKSGWGLGNLFGTGATGGPAAVEEVDEPAAEMVQLVSSITTNNGVGVCEWGEVCKLLGCKATPELTDVTLLGACKAILDVLNAHCTPSNGEEEGSAKAAGFGILKSSCNRIDINDLMMGINELLPQDQTNPWVESVMIKLTNSIANVVQSRFLGSLRHYEKWQKCLEAMKKDRVKRSGGSLKEDAEGTTEVDKHGQIRIIPNSEQIVDTDIVHGNRQRSHISVVLPLLETRLSAAHVQRASLQGELACCVQFGFIMSSPFIQRVIRGTRGRIRRNLRRFDTSYHSLHMATVTLQTWMRGIQGRKSFAKRKEALMGNIYEAMAIVCQKSIRMFIHHNKYRKYTKERKDAREWFAITRFQAMIRGFNARHRTTKIKAANAAEKTAEIKDWSIRLIQRWLRGCNARGTVIRSLKVRKALSKDVLLMGEKYLKSGDLWGFLKVVDDKLSILNSEIKQNQQKEDELAATFVNKVLAKRQGDFDGAWDRFSQVTNANVSAKLGTGGGGGGGESGADTLTAVGETSKQPWGPRKKGGASIGSNTGGSGGGGGGGGEGNSSAVSRMSKTSTGKASKKKSGTSLVASHPKKEPLGPGSDTSVPGPLLRRAVSATIQEGLTREKKAQRVDVDPMNYPGSHKQQAAEARQVQTSKKAGITIVNGKPVKRLPKKGEAPPKGKMYATTTDWAWANATGTVGPRPPSPPPEPRKVQPGESLLVDIPKGLDDQLERLLHVISLKTYIPEFSNAASPEEAYALYLRMPNGLAKMRYEIEAHKWCQPQINKLRVKGVHTIRDALPMNKFRQYLNSVETPLVVVGLATQWVRLLQAMGDVPSGKLHPESAVKQSEVREGVGTVGQLKRVGMLSPDKSAGEGSGGGAGVRAVRLADGTTAYQSIDESSSVAEDGTVMVGGKAVKIDHTPLFGGEETAGKVLLNLVEGGEWASIHASADDLLLNAAFLVVPHSTVRVDKFGTHEDFSEMGHQAFKAHTRALQFLESDEERREAVRKRFRAALLMSTPFILRLKAQGVRTVHDLISKAEIIVQLKLPPQMQTQVESMLSTAVAAAVSAKQAPAMRNHCDTAATTFTVPMIYDNKFQRGPFDPYGKPPRFIAPANLKSNKDRKAKNKAAAAAAAANSAGPSNSGATGGSSVSEAKGGEGEGEGGEGDSDEGDNLDGRGLWETAERREKHSLTLKNAKKLYSLQTADMHVSQEEKDEAEALRKELARREAEGGGVREEDEYEALERERAEAAKNRDGTAARRARLLMHDFEARVRAGFERPFKCRFEGCSQAFSRAYTLKIHEKSHKLFGNYHKWKSEPQLFLDKDKESMAKEAFDIAESRTMLPPIVRGDIDALKESAAAKAYEIALSSETTREYGDLYGKLRALGVDTDETERAFSMKLAACRWPEKRVPAAGQALSELPPSRGESRANTPSVYERPFSGENAMDGGVHLHQNWGVGANQHLRGHDVPLSRKSLKRAGLQALTPVQATAAAGSPDGRGKSKQKPTSKPGSPTRSILKVGSASGSRAGSRQAPAPAPAPAPASPSHSVLRDRLDQARATSPLFRSLASRDRLTSKGNVPAVDGLRDLMLPLGGSSQYSDEDYSSSHAAMSQWGSLSVPSYLSSSVSMDFQALSVDGASFMRPGTGMSRPGTVTSIDERGEGEGEGEADEDRDGLAIRFGNSLVDDDDELGGGDLGIDPFEQPYDLAA